MMFVNIQNPKPPDLSEDDFRRIRDLIYGSTGIFLSDSKRDMVRARLLKRIQQLGLATFSEYLDLVETRDTDRQEITQFINRLTTNESYFFRGPEQLSFFSQQILPEYCRNKASQTKRLRIWSAGCASGEEPYSLSILLQASLSDFRLWDIKILATDIDTEMLLRARKGEYPQRRLGELKNPTQYFEKITVNDKILYRVKERYRRFIYFKRHNLVYEPFPYQNYVDFVFCRNVLIYFSNRTKEVALDNLIGALVPGGYLFLGHSEGLIRHPQLNPIGYSIFQKGRNESQV